MRLIDADAISRCIAEYVTSNAYLGDTALDALKKVMDWIVATPTIEAEPVRHSCWTRHRECHECGELALYNGNGELVRSRFCPNCGAKMDEKEEK